MDKPLNPKDIQTAEMRASGIACTGPCYLVSVIAAPVTTSGYITVYDGVDTTGTRRLLFDITKGTTLLYVPVVPEYFAQGIYVAYSSFDGNVYVRFAKLQQGE